MPECCNPAGYRRLFNQKEARRSLRRYERKGLDRMERGIVEYMASRGLDGRSILEAGGGIGAFQIELLGAGAAHATNIELSAGYENVARDLLQRKDLADRVRRRIGDFTELADGLEADDVVMNRVICCYPFMERLMKAALSSSRRFVAVTFPRDRWGVRAGLAIGNAYCRIRGVDFRAYVHSPDAIVEAAMGSAFQIAYRARGFIWNAVVFERMAERSPEIA
jgi:magnesium-protoporphyrin O-methyltransferase